MQKMIFGITLSRSLLVGMDYVLMYLAILDGGRYDLLHISMHEDKVHKWLIFVIRTKVKQGSNTTETL